MGRSKRSGTAAGLAVLLAMAVLTSLPNGASAREQGREDRDDPATDARIEGKVVDERGRPIAGVRVRTVSTYPIPVGMEAVTYTRENGTYSLRKLGPATYRILLGDGTGERPAVLEYWPNAATYAEAADIVVTESARVRGIDAVMERGGRVQGLVGDGASSYVDDVSVFRWGPEGWERYGYRTEQQDDQTPGRYQVSGLPTGRYRVATASVGSFSHAFPGADAGRTSTCVPATWPSARTSSSSREGRSRVS